MQLFIRISMQIAADFIIYLIYHHFEMFKRYPCSSAVSRRNICIALDKFVPDNVSETRIRSMQQTRSRIIRPGDDHQERIVQNSLLRGGVPIRCTAREGDREGYALFEL